MLGLINATFHIPGSAAAVGDWRPQRWATAVSSCRESVRSRFHRRSPRSPPFVQYKPRDQRPSRNKFASVEVSRSDKHNRRHPTAGRLFLDGGAAPAEAALHYRDAPDALQAAGDSIMAPAPPSVRGFRPRHWRRLSACANSSFSMRKSNPDDLPSGRRATNSAPSPRIWCNCDVG